MAKVIGVGSAKSASLTIHDITCGSGSLLLKAHDEAKSTAGFDLTLYGQEMDNATAGLAKMNMILHDCPTAEIWRDNVLSSPHFKERDSRLKTFDFIVANPPFSFKSWTTDFNPVNDECGRFEVGVPPRKNGDFAFLLHILSTLKSTLVGSDQSSPRRFVLSWRGGRHPQEPRAPRVGQGHHRPSGQSFLRYRHSRVHHRARQGKRRCPQKHFHDRRLQGLYQRRFIMRPLGQRR